jgi:hypothetical protein
MKLLAKVFTIYKASVSRTYSTRSSHSPFEKNAVLHPIIKDKPGQDPSQLFA